MALSKEAKNRLALVTQVAQTTFHYGYLPVLIYLGFKRGSEPGMPPLSLLSLLWQ